MGSVGLGLRPVDNYAYTLYNGGDAGKMLHLKTRFQIARIVDQNRQVRKFIEKKLSYV